MEKFFTKIVKHKIPVIIIFAVLSAICLFCKDMVEVNYDINDYLPEDAHSTVSLDKMQDEFSGGIPNARVMIEGVTIPEALEYKEKIKELSGVTEVTWLDDAVDITTPLNTMNPDTVETYYKDGNALLTVTVDDNSCISAVSDIREIIGSHNAISGAAVSTADATTNTIKEVHKIAVVAVIMVLIVLVITTESWLEPIVILIGLGVAILINSGSNLIFGEISFVTNAAGSILQLAVSLDYSVFLIHRFTECRLTTQSAENAMVNALCKSTSSILSSGLTTVIGFLALVLMQFKIGPDLGLALAKGVGISLITVFVFMPCFVLSIYKLLDKTEHKKLLPDFKRFGKFIQAIAIPMVCVFAAVIAPSFLASGANDYYYGSSNIFGDNTQLGQDTAKIENTFGKSDTYVLLVPNGSIALQSEFSKELNSLPQVTSIISYVDTVGAEVPFEYLESDTLSKLVSDNYSRFVISVNVPYEGSETFSLVETIRSIAQLYYPDQYYLAGNGVSTYDLMNTVTADMAKVNFVAIGAVFIVLLITTRSVVLPAILVLSIETAIWVNLAIPYFMNSTIFYIAYLIISTIQLGATVDYAILMTERYKENRLSLSKKDSVIHTISDVTVSILTSGITLVTVGFLLGYISTNQLLAQLGIFIGRGAVLSLVTVFFVLPGLLYLLDKSIIRTKSTNKKIERSKENEKHNKQQKAFV